MNKLNPHSGLASFYRHFYVTTQLPNNLCNYFWGLMFAFIMFPFVWIAMAWNRFNNFIYFDTRLETVFETYTAPDGYVGSISAGEKPKNVYAKKFDTVNTAFGLIFTLLAFLVGGLSFGMILRLSNFNIIEHVLGNEKGYLPMFLIYLIGIATAITFILLFVLIVWMVTFVSKFIPEKKSKTTVDVLEDWDKEWRDSQAKREAKAARLLRRQTNPNFFILTWRWMVAFKEKNCPIITWDYEQKKK